ncbi:hypothetical protein [Sporosarcina sp. P13]|nr:hypothetical protein [Sporosarcina sp. P13]
MSTRTLSMSAGPLSMSAKEQQKNRITEIRQSFGPMLYFGS